MTNETVAVGGRLVDEITCRLDAGGAYGQDVVNWVSAHWVGFVANLVTAAVMLLVGWLAIKLLSFLIVKAVVRTGRTDSLLANFVRALVVKGGWAILIVMALGRLGVNVAPLIAGLGVTGFILGFAFQESLGNFASGLMIAVNEPFKVGDYVIVAGHEGTVLKVDVMATVLATADNKKIVIPNKSAWGGPIVNFSALGKRRVDLTVAVPCECDLAKAIATALAAIKAVPGVLAEPAPGVAVAGIVNGGVQINVRPWTEGATYWDVYSAGYEAVKAAFEANGVSLAVPRMTLVKD